MYDTKSWKFNNKIMKKNIPLIQIVIIYLFLISNGITKESNYYNEGIKVFSSASVMYAPFA